MEVESGLRAASVRIDAAHPSVRGESATQSVRKAALFSGWDRRFGGAAPLGREFNDDNWDRATVDLENPFDN